MYIFTYRFVTSGFINVYHVDKFGETSNIIHYLAKKDSGCVGMAIILNWLTLLYPVVC